MAWPLHGLTLSTPDLVLRVMTEADALALGELVPDDVTTDPSHPDLGARVEQTYWRHMACTSPGGPQVLRPRRHPDRSLARRYALLGEPGPRLLRAPGRLPALGAVLREVAPGAQR